MRVKLPNRSLQHGMEGLLRQRHLEERVRHTERRG